MKILISGGHLTPALAFIDYLQEKKISDTFVFAGRLYSQKDSKQVSREKIEIEKRKLEFIPFNSVKLSSNNIFAKIQSIPILITSTLKAIIIIAKQKPDIFLSFGGYLAVPLAFASWVMRVKIITHEQTRTAGVANKIIATFANRVAISYKESASYFPKSRTKLTGNLIRASILQKNNVAPKWFKSDIKQNILYITGGSQGSEIINFTVAQIANQLCKEWSIIHQCGGKTSRRNYKNELEKVKSKISKVYSRNYYIREWITEDELSWIYSNTKGIVSRAGANTTEEIAIKRIPSVLIPLPFSHNDEQLMNAQALSNNKQAILLEQKYLTPETLLESIGLIKKYNRKFSRNLELFSRIENSEKKLYNLLKTITKK